MEYAEEGTRSWEGLDSIQRAKGLSTHPENFYSAFTMCPTGPQVPETQR